MYNPAINSLITFQFSNFYIFIKFLSLLTNERRKRIYTVYFAVTFEYQFSF